MGEVRTHVATIETDPGPVLPCGCVEHQRIDAIGGPGFVELPACQECGVRVTTITTARDVMEIGDVMEAWPGGPLMEVPSLFPTQVPISVESTAQCGHLLRDVSWRIRTPEQHRDAHAH